MKNNSGRLIINTDINDKLNDQRISGLYYFSLKGSSETMAEMDDGSLILIPKDIVIIIHILINNGLEDKFIEYWTDDSNIMTTMDEIHENYPETCKIDYSDDDTIIVTRERYLKKNDEGDIVTAGGINCFRKMVHFPKPMKWSELKIND